MVPMEKLREGKAPSCLEAWLRGLVEARGARIVSMEASSPRWVRAVVDFRPLQGSFLRRSCVDQRRDHRNDRLMLAIHRRKGFDFVRNRVLKREKGKMAKMKQGKPPMSGPRRMMEVAFHPYPEYGGQS
jgi:hypothetical protein